MNKKKTNNNFHTLAIRTLIFFCFVFSGAFMRCGQQVEDPDETLKQLTETISRSEGAEAKVEGLLRQSEIYYDQLGIYYKSDSVLAEAIQLADSTSHADLKLRVYMQVLQSMKWGYVYPIYTETFKKLAEFPKQELDTETRFEVYETLCNACCSIGEGSACCSIGQVDCRSFADSAMLLAKGRSDKLMEIRAQLLYGYREEVEIYLYGMSNELYWKSENIEQTVLTFNHYARAELAALELEGIDRREANRRVWGSFANFYALVGDYDRALEYNERLKLDNQRWPDVDSTRMQWLLLDELEYLYNKDNSFPLYNRIKSIIEYASRRHQRRLMNNAMWLLRTALIENEQYETMRNLYVDEYPEELEVFAWQSPYHHFTVHGFIHEANGRLDEARDNLESAMRYKSRTDHYSEAQARYHFGQFCRRQGYYDEAITQWVEAFKLARKIEYAWTHNNELQRDIAVELERIYTKKGEYVQAQRYAGILYRLEMEDTNSRTQSLFPLQVQHQRAIEARKAELAQYEEKRRHKRQFWIISILLIILLTSLIIDGRSRATR